MKKILITHSSFTGAIEVVYHTDGRILLIDYTNAVLPDSYAATFKAKVPVQLNAFEAAFKDSKCTCVSEDYVITFEQFWRRYGLAINKDRALKLWNKMSRTEQVEAYLFISIYDRHLADNTWKTKMYPDTYLRNKFFNNDISKL